MMIIITVRIFAVVVIVIMSYKIYR